MKVDQTSIRKSVGYGQDCISTTNASFLQAKGSSWNEKRRRRKENKKWRMESGEERA
jgi:hypothetical protein